MDSAKFALHRPEFLQPLRRGEGKIASIMHGNTLNLPTGTILVEAGAEHHYVYRLLSGWACRVRTLADGRNQFIQIFLPGDLFAMKGMFVIRHTDSVRVVSNAVAERVDRKTLHRAYVQDSDVATFCIWQVMEEERRLHSWVVSLGQGTAEERLALLLMDFRARLVSAGVVPENSLVYGMPLTQAHLASHLGITAVHVNRVLRKFRNSGIVTVQNGLVRIIILNLLAHRASPLLDCSERCETTAHICRRPLESNGIPA
jgi:CRP/FNR family transcriptional regulator